MDVLAQRKQREAAAKADAVVGILIDWSDWMKGYEGIGKGYPKRSIGLQSGYCSSTFEDMCDSADAIRNQVVDSCIDDLAPDQSAAIYRQYLAAVFRMRDFASSLIAAHEALALSLRRKGVLW